MKNVKIKKYQGIMYVNLAHASKTRNKISYYINVAHLINYSNVQEVLSIYFTWRETKAFPVSAI